MRLRYFPCPQCQAESLESQYVIHTEELLNDLTFRSTCPNGHRTAIVVEAQRFEVLFDMGVSALHDGYCREAVSSFAASLERFHEFCIQVFATVQRIPNTEFVATWKLLAKQSERQLGAFYVLYLCQFKTPPSANQRMVEFRNDVVHKGRIPSTDEAVNFAEYVYDSITSTVREMRRTLAAQVEQVRRDNLHEAMSSVSDATFKTGLPFYSLVWLSGPEQKFGRRPFREALKASRDDHRLELEHRLEDFDQEDDD